ncbi:MAG TPA: glycosyltransferase [Candidatus Omnitrophota bacterium]|nr:glycosyltransferase [Candidatus Omnitrophota bacterium]
MKVSGFTIVRNARKYNYPVLESIRSILPICDEFVINIGDSEDDTRALILSLNDPKIKIVETRWDMAQGKEVLSQQTNIALSHCSGDWAFYVQSDEVIHEEDLPRLWRCMKKFLLDRDVDALRFKWLHFYGSYYRYRIDHGWYQKQDRIIRNNGTVESFGDAYAFQRKDGKPLRRKNTDCFVYHYGWVQPQDVMASRRKNAEDIGFVQLKAEERQSLYTFGDLGRFPAYFGSHPRVMQQLVRSHETSESDLEYVHQQYWWHPCRWFKVRYKTFHRVKEKIS